MFGINSGQVVTCGLQADADKHCKKAKFEKGRVQQCLRRHRMVCQPILIVHPASLCRVCNDECGVGHTAIYRPPDVVQSHFLLSLHGQQCLHWDGLLKVAVL